MSILERYQAYADDFEKSYDDDDWTRIGRYFTEGAVYEGNPDAVGREAVLAKLKAGVDGFDRKMDSRTPDPRMGLTLASKERGSRSSSR